jgi:hypothetical protein
MTWYPCLVFTFFLVTLMILFCVNCWVPNINPKFKHFQTPIAVTFYRGRLSWFVRKIWELFDLKKKKEEEFDKCLLVHKKLMKKKICISHLLWLSKYLCWKCIESVLHINQRVWESLVVAGPRREICAYWAKKNKKNLSQNSYFQENNLGAGVKRDF